ncbi:BTAD domain-containing putative transcriptional regulator [Streptomyces sp. P9(2023)]|uniref:AfsR/SARP family transcriptional regulator n=1 Tax=Streptomyces sp. P9(2023) TaxID=3064394 RepID=UPI0028F419D6|nr:BTAD domain-containing putative transcriptional regulator [Streptomyces sp. P9(2023)]MDT9689871.1 BTAD domain-containing putative transcriptional regulator [Streptomyces sp. P9(2023)]
MHYRILGPVRVWRGHTELTSGPPKQQALLALLLARAGQLLTPQEVIDALWEEPPGSAVNVVHRHVGALRRLLEPELPSRADAQRLLRQAGGYRLRVDAGELDLLHFRSLREEARRAIAGGDAAKGVGLLVDALGMWGGLAGTGLPPRVAAHPLFTALNQEYLATVKEAADAALTTDHTHGELVLSLLQQAGHHYPFDEALYARLVTALAALGRQAEALAVHASVRSRLVDELGVDPGPELRAAHERVLRQTVPVTVPAAVPVAVPVAAPITAPVPAADGEDRDGGDGGSDGDSGDGAATVARPSAPPQLLPAQLPADIATFAGRESELDLSRTLPATDAAPSTSTTAVIAAISGMAGVGKTTLAVHWAHQVTHRFPDGQLYVNLRGFHPTMAPLDPPDVMREVISALGVPPQRVPDKPEALPAFYRSLLAPRRLLILLDNARDSEQVRPLLPGAPGCLTLITSRHRLDGLVVTHTVRFIGLEVLSRAEGVEFLTRRLGVERIAAEPAAAEDIIELCGHLPLALAIVGARALLNPRFALAAVAEELRATRGSLDAFTSSDASADARSVFSWSYQALGPAAARLFRLLGGAHPGPELSVPAAASLSGVAVRDARRHIAELVDSHLLTEDAPGRFSCHELLRAYAKELSASRDDEADRAEAGRRLVEHYLHSAQAADALLAPYRDRVPLPPPGEGVVPEELTGMRQAAQWLHRQRQVLLSAVERAAADGGGGDGLCWRLAAALELFLDRAGRWDEQRGIQELALRAARLDGDATGQAYALRALGFAYCRLGRYGESHETLSRALDRFTEAGDPDGQATAHRNLAFLSNSMGDHEQALEHYRLASALYDVSGHRTGAAAVLNEIGWTHILTGAYEQALNDCGKAVVLHQENGNRNGEAAAWDSVGYARHHRGEYREALAGYGKAIALYRDIGDLSLQADTLSHIGDSHEGTGDPEAAAVAWREAAELFEHLGHPDARQVRERLARLGSPAAAADESGGHR